MLRPDLETLKTLIPLSMYRRLPAHQLRAICLVSPAMVVVAAAAAARVARVVALYR